MHVAEKSPFLSLSSHPIIYFVLAPQCVSISVPPLPASLSLSVRWECECSGTFFALSLTASEDFERAARIHASFLTRGWVKCQRSSQDSRGNHDGRGRRGEINQFHVTKRNPGRMILQLMETQIEIVRRKITILSDAPPLSP